MGLNISLIIINKWSKKTNKFYDLQLASEKVQKAALYFCRVTDGKWLLEQDEENLELIIISAEGEEYRLSVSEIDLAGELSWEKVKEAPIPSNLKKYYGKVEV